MSSSLPPEYGVQHPLSTSRESRASDWFGANARAIGIAGAALVVAAVAGVAWRSSERAKNGRAEQALYQAEASLAQGDASRAEKALGDVATRYRGTSGGAQAQLLLAQTLYDAGRFQDGLAVLGRSKPPAEMADAVQLLTAAGYEGAGRPLDAARIYERLADASGVIPSRVAELRAAAARAYQLGNDRVAASRVWRTIAGGPSGPLVDEARVRLGELTAS